MSTRAFLDVSQVCSNQPKFKQLSRLRDTYAFPTIAIEARQVGGMTVRGSSTPNLGRRITDSAAFSFYINHKKSNQLQVRL